MKRAFLIFMTLFAGSIVLFGQVPRFYSVVNDLGQLNRQVKGAVKEVSVAYKFYQDSSYSVYHFDRNGLLTDWSKETFSNRSFSNATITNREVGKVRKVKDQLIFEITQDDDHSEERSFGCLLKSKTILPWRSVFSYYEGLECGFDRDSSVKIDSFEKRIDMVYWFKQKKRTFTYQSNARHPYWSTRTKLNLKGLARKTTYFEANKRVAREWYQYQNKALVSETLEHVRGGTGTVEQIKYRYSEQGLLGSSEHKTRDFETGVTIPKFNNEETYSFQLDEKGNWIRLNGLNTSNGYEEVCERSFVYYISKE